MNNFANRRARLIKEMRDGSVAILFSSDNMSSAEKFNVNRNFYYLTGIDAKEMILVLENRNGKMMEHIFILPYDEYLAKWVGGRMSDEEVSDISDIKDVQYIEDFNDFVERIVEQSRASQFTLYLDLFKREDGLDTIAGKYANEFLVKHPNIEVRDIFSHMANLRLIKDDVELNNMAKAIAITKVGIESMMRTIKPGMNEMTLEGIFDLALKQNLCNETAFKTIAAGGQRACILHYSDNNQVLEDGDLFLTDLGATYNHYCADVTRTYPVNGKFSERQKEVYSMVLNAQKLVQENAKPGITIRELNNMVVEFYKKYLPSIGLNEDVSEYYYHGVSHQIGLDCHDADGGLGQTLKPGMVISNEPGLYIEEEGIGIRIEDDLLITDTGCQNLTQSIVKEIDDIEKIMSK